MNFVAYKVYKELERQLKEKKSDLSAEKVIEIVQSIFEIEAKSHNNKTYTKRLLISEEHMKVKKLFNFGCPSAEVRKQRRNRS